MSQSTISLTPEQLQTLKSEVGQLKLQIHDLSDRCVRIETLLEHFGLENSSKDETLSTTSRFIETSERDLNKVAYVDTKELDESASLAQGQRPNATVVSELEEKPEVDEKDLVSWAILYQGSLPPDARPCYKGSVTSFFDDSVPGPLVMQMCLTLLRSGYRLGAKYYSALAKVWNRFEGTGPSISDGVHIFDFLQFRETLLELGGPGFHAYVLRHGLIQPWQMDEQGHLSEQKMMANGQWGAQCSVMCKCRWQNPEKSRRLFHEYLDTMDDNGVLHVLKTFHIRPSVLDETIAFEMLHSDVTAAHAVALSIIRSIPHSAYSIACTRVIKLCLGYNVRLHKWLMPERSELKGFVNLGLDIPKTRSSQDLAELRCEVMRGMDWADLMQLTQTQEPRETITRLQDFALQTGIDVSKIETMLAERIAVAQDAVAARTLMSHRKTRALPAYAKLLPLLQPWEIDLDDIEISSLASNIFCSVEPHFEPLDFKPISKEWGQELTDWVSKKLADDDNFELDANLATLIGLYLPLDCNTAALKDAVEKLNKKRGTSAKDRASRCIALCNDIEKYLQVRQELASLQNAYLLR